MFAQELELVHESVEESGDYASVMEAIDSQWIEQSLLSANKASIRNRRLPAQQAVWLVLWMGLIRNQSIKEVCSSMDIALQPGNNCWSRVAPSVLTDCRRRLGEAPMAYLFKSTTSAWLEQALGSNNALGLTTLAVDGTVFRCQDSEENANEFGFISKTHKPYPQLRLVSLISTETRMVLGAAFDGCHVGEITLAQRIVQDASDNSLTLFDRCYFSADLLLNWQSAGTQRHWLTPVKSKMRYEVVEEFANNDLLIDMPVSPQARKKNPELPETWRARFIAYQAPKGEIKGFVTSLTDPVRYPLDKLLNIYWQRWEIEEGYGELKQTQLQSKVTLRSRFAEGVRQELWGVLTAYNLVRLEMVAIAKE
ncbi:IS4 family transposase, partial [Shewanella sp. UCD-KL21]|uniref:IS4 family transposase n=4 Tax=Shewanella sp. UCD-KL21 TaxID=1917164 RepID=UPI0009FAE743